MQWCRITAFRWNATFSRSSTTCGCRLKCKSLKWFVNICPSVFLCCSFSFWLVCTVLILNGIICNSELFRMVSIFCTSLLSHTLRSDIRFIMAALWHSPGHYIFALWFLSSCSFFLAYSQRSEIGCLSYFYTWCGLSANLECMSEMCCTWLTGNTGRKMTQKSPSARHRTTLSGCIFATKACINNRKKTC